MNKPKLDLQVNIPATIKLLMDKPVTGSNAYGNWYLFGVEYEGEEYSFFATEEVAKFAEENNLRKGDSIKVTKTFVKVGKKNQTSYQLEIVSKGQQSDPASNGTGQSVVNGNTHINGNANGQFVEDYNVMHDCLAQGIKLQQDLGSVIDVNRIAITLFITRTKAKNGSYMNY